MFLSYFLDHFKKLYIYYRLACVAQQFLSEETAITNPNVARSLGKRQLRNRLQGLLAFFVSPVRWRTGYSHWIRRVARQSKFRLSLKGRLQGSAMITMQIFGSHASRKSLLNILCKYREIVICQTRARYSRRYFRS